MAGFARIWNLADATTWTSGGSHAKPRLEFTVADLDSGDSISTVKVRVSTASTGGTHAYLATLTGSALTTTLANGYFDADYAMLNQTQGSSERWYTVEAIDALGESSFGATAADSVTRTGFKVSWGQAIYEFDNNGAGIAGFGSPGWAYSLTSASTTQAAFLFANADDNGANRTAWQSNISAVPNTKNFLNVLVRLSNAASGVDATLASMTFNYQTSSQQPDNWNHYPTGKWALDIGGARRFGSRSYRCVVGAADYHYAEPFRVDNSPADGIVVQPNTDYVFSAYVRTEDPPGPLTTDHVVRLQIADAAGTSTLAFGSLYGDSYNDGPGATLNSGIRIEPSNPSSDLIYPEGWQRLHLHFRTDANTELVRPSIVYTKADGSTPTNNGDVFWVDACKWEEGTVVSAWTPGFISPAVVIDSWGVHLDGEAGAVLTLVKTDGTQTATLDQVVSKVNEVGGTASQVFRDNAANSDYVVKIDKSGDTVERGFFGLDSTGRAALEFGSGAATRDTIVRRDAANRLRLEGTAAGAAGLNITAPVGQNSVMEVEHSGDTNGRVSMHVSTAGVASVQLGGGGTRDVRLARTAARKVVLDDAASEANTVVLDVAGQLDVKEMTAPGTPAAGRYSIYAKTDGKLYGKNDGGSEHDLTAGGGGLTDHTHATTGSGATGGGSTLQPVVDHLNDTADAHDASAISVADASDYLTATEVEAAIKEVFEKAAGLPLYAFSSTTTQTSVASGTFRFNNATVGSATNIYIHDTDVLGVARDLWINHWDDSNASPARGYLYIMGVSDPTKWAIFYVNGALTDNGTDYTVPITSVNNVGSPFADGSEFRFMFTRTTNRQTAIVTSEISNDQVTYAKMQNVASNNRVLGRVSGADGDVEELTGAQVAALIATPDVQVFTSGSGNWSKPANARFVRVRVVGCGGGGGGAATTGATQRTGGGGGGGGGYAEKVFAASALGSTEAYSIGSGGTAGGTGGTNGGTGGTCSFGASGTLVQATGGSGGTGAAATGAQAVPGGAGGIGSGGDLNVKGGPGGAATMSSATSGAFQISGHGGNTALGGGAEAVNGAATGVNGYAYGGGASGGVNPPNTGTGKAGGVGAAGVVIVETFF